MRPIFSIVVLLVVLAIVGLVAKKQLQAYKAVPPGVSASASAAGVDVPTGSPAQIEQQVKQDVERSLQQGAARASDAEQ